MHRKARDYAPPPLVSRLPSLVSRPSSPVSRPSSLVPGAQRSACARPLVPGAQRSVRARPLVPRPAAAAAPSPPKPLRGQADSRHSQQKQAADRGPPSSVQRPRKSPGRGQSPFLVSAPGGKNSNHFSLRCVRDEKSLSRSDAQNAVQSPSGSAGRALAIAPPPKGRQRGAPGKRRRTPPLPGLSSAKRLRRFTDDSHARYDPRTPGRPGRRRSRRCGRC